jgi:hypothetical protein
MRNILFRGRAGRQLFEKCRQLPRPERTRRSRAEARVARTAGIGLACVYLACLALAAYGMA